MALLARLLALHRERPLFAWTSVLLVAVLLAYPAVDWWLRSIGVASAFDFQDFTVYLRAVQRWQAGEPLYVPNESGGFHGAFLYPPVSVLLFAPFVGLGAYPEAQHAWTVFSFGLLWIGLQLVARSLGADLAWYERGLLAVATFGFHPVLLALKMGQTAAFLPALLCFAFVGLQRGRDPDAFRGWRLGSGAVTALVGAVKPSYGPVGAHLLADRDRLAGALLTGVVVLAASLALFGPDTHLAYVDVVRWGIAQGDQIRSPALWLPPYYKPLGWLPWNVSIRVALAAGVAAYAALSGPDADREVFALGVAAFPIVSPLTYTYYLAVLAVAAPVMVAVELDRDGYPAVPVVALLLVHLHAYGLKYLVEAAEAVLPAAQVLHEVVYFFLQPGLWGNALLFGLAALRVAESVSLPARADDLVPAERLGRLLGR